MRSGARSRRERTDVSRRFTKRLLCRLTDSGIVDKVLDSCFQLLSLFFMTIGRTSEAPAAYSLTSTIKRLLDHLTEAELFSAKDLESMSKTLDRLFVTVKNAGSKHSPHLIELLSERVDRCKSSLSNLRRKLDRLGDTLPSVHEKLISILRSMSLANTRSRVGGVVALYDKMLIGVSVLRFRGGKAPKSTQGD